MRCLGVLTDKIEDARQSLIHDTKTLEAIARRFPIDLDKINCEDDELLLQMFTLLTSLGRTNSVNKKILNHTFKEWGIDIF